MKKPKKIRKKTGLNEVMIKGISVRGRIKNREKTLKLLIKTLLPKE